MGKKLKFYDRNREAFYRELFDTKTTVDMYLDLLTGIALSCFRYENLPDTIDERFLEWCLFYDGQAVLFRDDAIGELALQTMLNGQLNVYRYPTRNRAYAVNGYQKELTLANSVIIYNNMTRTNSVNVALKFAQKLANIDLTIQTNVQAQKTPYIIKASEKEKTSMLQVYQKIAGNEPFIFGTNTLDLSEIKVLDLKAPYVSDKLYKLKVDTWNEYLTYLGVTSVQFEKRERVNTDEIMTSLGGSYASRLSRLNAREQAIDAFNSMFGTNVKVEFADPKVMETKLDNSDETMYDEGGFEE